MRFSIIRTRTVNVLNPEDEVGKSVKENYSIIWNRKWPSHTTKMQQFNWGQLNNQYHYYHY
jgi:hypothetical protein